MSAPTEHRAPVYLARHGRTALNAEGRLRGHLDPPLDDTGHALAAISVAGPVGRFRPQSHVDAVRAAATGLGSVVARRRSLR